MVLLKEMHFSFHFLGLKIICLENFHKSFLVNDCSESQSADRGLHSREEELGVRIADMSTDKRDRDNSEKQRQTELQKSFVCFVPT